MTTLTIENPDDPFWKIVGPLAREQEAKIQKILKVAKLGCPPNTQNQHQKQKPTPN